MLYNRVDNIKSSLRLFLGTVHAICEVIDSPRSLAVSLCLQYQEWEEYLDLTIDPGMYEDPRRFAEDYLVTEILRKNEDLPLGIDRSAVALEAFKASEADCKLSNERLCNETPEWFFHLRRNIALLLGPMNRGVLDFVDAHFRFGPGATTGVPGVGSVLSDKFDSQLHITADLIPFYRSILGDSWWEHHKEPVIVVDGNKFTTVPKSWKTDRGICVEPTLNIYVQLGIGAYLRRRLRRFGVDLDSQEVNRWLAERAHSWHLATIDLSAASDSLSKKLVEEFFPPAWVELLALPRSGFCTLPDGSCIELEKWSSMGNGYTFELESLVFWAVCMTIVPRRLLPFCNVYGDDIIVPSDYAQALIDALNFLGFRVNQAKSCLAGSFFESCGHDYFRGVNVRPFYLKCELDSVPTALQVANKLRLWSRRLNMGDSCDARFRAVWLDLVKKLPKVWRKTAVPIDFTDAGLIKSLDEACAMKPRDGLEGRMARYVVMTPRYKRKYTFGVLLSRLTRLYSSPDTYRNVGFSYSDVKEALFTKGREPRRGYLGRIKPRSGLVHRWSTGLSWSFW